MAMAIVSDGRSGIERNESIGVRMQSAALLGAP
jgi:hypothetical protein